MKIGKTSDAVVDESVDFGIDITSIQSITVSPSGLVVDDEAISDTTVTFELSGGTNNVEYRVTVKALLAGQVYTEKLYVYINDSELSSNYYGSIFEADEYFELRQSVLAWTEASNVEKRGSLVQATRLVDRLNFKGEASGDLQFPRGSDTSVPKNIEFATYEIALKLLDDYDPDMEALNFGVSSSKYESASRETDSKFVPEHISAGIPSYVAWTLLRPYLRDFKNFSISRVN